MRNGGRCFGVAGSVLLLMLASSGRAVGQAEPPPPPRAIPGITAPDAFPQACVSCHVVLPDGHDVRLSTLVKQWMGETNPLLLAAAQAAAPAGMTLTGRHPDVTAMVTSIPDGCLTCHGRNSTMAPPFGRLLHRIHLAGGETSIFLSAFQGECTHCHKLDKTSGSWSIPSGPEP